MLKSILTGVVLLAGLGGLAVYSGKIDPSLIGLGATEPATGNDPLVADPAAKKKGGEARAKGAKGSGGQQVAVEAARVISIQSSNDLRAIGSLQSDESVQISSEIAGRVIEIAFKEGASVAEGEVLVKLDDALVKAETADAEARLEFAQGNLGRANTLARSGNVTERARDEASTNAATALAAVELAKVRLSKHVIRAPFAGVVGIRRVSVGAYVAVGQAIVNLEKIDTLKLDFTVPEVFLAQVKPGQAVEIAVDAIPDRTFPGEIYAIDPQVDVNGRSLRMRARLNNPDRALRPGLFARVVVKGPTRNVLVVPESAVVPRGQEKIVYRIENGRAVEAKVELGLRKDGQVEVVKGLGEGDLVVTAGQAKLRDGAAVEVVASQDAPGRKGA